MIKILSGEKRGIFPFLLRLLLLPFYILYFALICNKLFLYKLGFFKQKRVKGVKIVCVGNLSAGGTGKTPAVAYIVKLIHEFTENIAVVSRGYRKIEGEELNDEGNLLKSLYPDVLQFQNPDRFKACVEAKDAGAEIIILDDGFSHMRLARDIDIVLIDATRPHSNLELLPRGLLREPMFSLKRASTVIITRSNQVSTNVLLRLTNKITRNIREDTKILLSQHKPVCFRDFRTGEQSEITEFKGRNAFVFAGIGNPSSFQETCKEAKLKITEFREFSNHHNYKAEEITGIQESAKASGAEIIVTTSKDAVKLTKLQFYEVMPTYILEIEFTLTQNEENVLKNLIFHQK